MLVEAYRAFLLLEKGVSLAEQGWTDERGEAPTLLLDWIGHVAPVVYEVRAKNQDEALKKAQEEAARGR